MKQEKVASTSLMNGKLTVGPTRLVERFYHEVWNSASEAVAREIMHENFIFRASLGTERRGPDGFIGYMHSVRDALPDFVCNIREIVAEDHHAVARMEFVGTHKGTFFNVPATGRKIVWAGAAFFKTDEKQIAELWVLGDIDAVKQLLNARTDVNFVSR